MHIIKKELDIDETLNKKIINILKFLNIKTKIEGVNILNIKNTNLVYIEPHKFRINNITYLFFNECNNTYINSLEKSILITELKDFITKSLINDK